MFNKDEKKLTLEEKVDLLLKYHKQMRSLAIVRGIFSFTFFMIFVILPIIATVYLWDTLSAYMQGAAEQYQSAIESLGTVNQAGESMESLDLDALLEKMGMGKTE